MIRVIAAALLALLLAAGCSSDDDADDEPDDTAAATTAAPDDGGGDEGGGDDEPVFVAIVSVPDGFAPADLEVPAGTTVLFRNNDGNPHTTTSEDGGWDSGTMNLLDEFEVTLNETGAFTYICTIHPSMEATITVS